jgi:hypothetical protein
MKLSRKIIIPLILFLLACNLPTFASTPAPVVTDAPVVVDVDTATATLTETSAPVVFTDIPLPTQTFTPSFTSTVTQTTTPLVPVVTGVSGAVNCRIGPGIGYEPIGVLDAGAVAQITGKSEEGSWWQIIHPIYSDPCWVSSAVVIASGNLSGIPVVVAPQALVKSITLDISPSTVTVPGCVFPGPKVELTGTITTNGPVKVIWHLETSEGEITSDDKLKFDEFGAKKIQDVHSSGGVGTHWIKLVITFPNFMQVQTTYKTQC